MSAFDALSSEDVRRLIAAATSEECRPVDLRERRRGLLISLAEMVRADAAHWAWGRGDPLTDSVMPLAMLDYGYLPEQLVLLIEHGLRPEAMSMFQARVMPMFNGRRHAGVTRRDVIPDTQWRQSELWQGYVHRLGLDSWVHAINYRAKDTWTCLHFARRTGREEFGEREAALADLALSGVTWLNALVEEHRRPPDAVVTLTPRQRTVMLMVLDGKSRREIAAALAISEYTVDDHIRAVYVHFGVNSLGELAARFLKMA